MKPRTTPLFGFRAFLREKTVEKKYLIKFNYLQDEDFLNVI